MTSAQLHRAIARATGEDLTTIAAYGFHLLVEDDPSEDDLPGQVVDWDDNQDFQ